ncbi:MAG TPA: S8 family serine peptidase [Candidatus Eisenbacteria bacterium]|nr:S8 family serine peptidase [Candidatus Eisenbacteria bacterium]
MLVTFRDPLAGNKDLFEHFIGKDGRRRPTPSMLQALSDSLAARRDTLNQTFADTLRAHGATILPTRFILIQALLVTIRLGAIPDLARNPDIIHFDPLHGDSPPTGPCGKPEMTCRIAAKMLGFASPLVKLSDLVGQMALLDTGIRQTHDLLRTSTGPMQPSPIRRCLTCGPTTCIDEGAAQYDVEDAGHGTATAAILGATSSMGIDHRGLTRSRIDSYRVYDPAEGHLSVNEPGAQKAFDDAVLGAAAHYLIVAEIADGNGYGPLSAAANTAYLRNAMVIAANGNEHSASPTGDVLAQPAAASCALGVGMYCIADRSFDQENTRGWTYDGRGKPDLGGLTSIHTASNVDDTKLNAYPGTSGATPTVAAAALVLYNWLRGRDETIKPGFVYAALILSGQNASVHPEQGAGLIQIPGRGVLLAGEVEIGAGDSLEIMIPQEDVRFQNLDGAIWWPEYGTSDGGAPAQSERAWVAMRLNDPLRQTTAVSDVRWSVFQRAGIQAAPVQGRPWYITLVGRSVPEGPKRLVYYAVWAR